MYDLSIYAYYRKLADVSPSLFLFWSLRQHQGLTVFIKVLNNLNQQPFVNVELNKSLEG